MREICQMVNYNCLVMSCCTQKCSEVKTEIYYRLLEFKYYVEDDYDRVYNEMLKSHCCPICNNKTFYYKPFNFREYMLDCVYCRTGLLLEKDNIFINKNIKVQSKYKLTEISKRETVVTWANNEKTTLLIDIFKSLNII